MTLVLLGPPGAGKGSQAEVISRECGYEHISTGDILRESVKKGTELGRRAREYMDRGLLVPDDVMVGLVREVLTEVAGASGIILDGFPRTVHQAEELDRILDELGFSLEGVVYLDAPEDTLIRRLSGRRLCEDCGEGYHAEFQKPEVPGRCDSCGGRLVQREDDREEAVAERLRVYERETHPLVEYYREKGLLSVVDAEGSIDDVDTRICAVLKGSSQ